MHIILMMLVRALASAEDYILEARRFDLRRLDFRASGPSGLSEKPKLFLRMLRDNAAPAQARQQLAVVKTCLSLCNKCVT